MNLGYLEQGILVKDLKVLMKRCIKRVDFYLIDLLSLLPSDFLYFVLRKYRFWPIVRLNRLLKLKRVLEFRAQTETSTNHPYFFRIVSIFTVIIIIIHWNACTFFMISEYTDNFELDFDEPFNSPGHQFMIQYSKCFYRSTLQLTTISNIQPPQSSFEKFYMILSFLSGVLVFAVIVGSVTEIIDNLNIKRSEFQEKIDAVKGYMQLAGVNQALQERVIKWFNHSWSKNNGMDEEVIFQEFLPENLQVEIAINIHLETLKKVHIFQDCEPGLLQQLVTRLKLLVFSPSDYICKKGDIGREMYFIKSGKLNVVNDDGSRVFATLTEGSFFGEISILDIPGSKSGNRRTANIRSVGYSDLFCLTKADLWQALAEYPLAKKALLEKGKSLLRKDNLINEEIAAEAEELEKRNESVVENLNTLGAEVDHLDQKATKIIEIIKEELDLIVKRAEYLENRINDV